MSDGTTPLKQAEKVTEMHRSLLMEKCYSILFKITQKKWAQMLENETFKGAKWKATI